MFPIPKGNSGGSPGFAFIGISKGSKSKSVANDCLRYDLVSKNFFALNSESLFAVSISFNVATPCIPFIS